MTEEAISCYICLSQEPEFTDSDPCACKGSIKIHKQCLLELKATTPICGICKELWYEHGLIKTWYPQTGELESEVMYVNGKRHGTYTYYYRNGQVSYTEDYKNGVVHGFKRGYYPGGQLELETFVLDGYHQYSTLFWPNGIKKVEMLYAHTNNKLNGPFKRYSNDGKLILECTYINGVIQGEFKYYRKNGSLESIVLYKDNKPGYKISIPLGVTL